MSIEKPTYILERSEPVSGPDGRKLIVGYFRANLNHLSREDRLNFFKSSASESFREIGFTESIMLQKAKETAERYGIKITCNQLQ